MKTKKHSPKALLLAFFAATFLSSCATESTEQAAPGTWIPTKTELTEKDNLNELNLSEQGLSNISKQIGQFKNLEKLSLSGNKLTALPDDLASLSKLYKLNLAKNEFTQLPEVVLKMEGLQELDLRHNKLKTIPQSITNLKSLHTLYIGGNDIDETQRATLREWLPKVKVIATRN